MKDISKQTTAVEWLIQQFNLQAYTPHVEHALAMEKEQIVKAHYEGFRYRIGTTEISEQYYNDTYGK